MTYEQARLTAVELISAAHALPHTATAAGVAVTATQAGYSVNGGPPLRRHEAVNRVASLLAGSASATRIRKSLDLQADDWPALDEAARQAGATGWRNLLLRIARGEIVCSPR